MTLSNATAREIAPATIPPPRTADARGGPIVAAEYLRRSRARHERDRNASREEQAEQIRREAKRRGDTITRTFDEGDGVGASRHSRKARPAWDAAMAALRAGEITRLYVYEMSRADRRGALAGVVHELVEVLAPKGRILVIVDEDIDSTDRERMIDLAEQARKETEKLSSRVRRTKERRKRDGMWLGGTTPYGILAEHDANGEPTGAIVRDPQTWPVARRIADMVLGLGTPDGKPMSLRAVALTLTGEGVPSPNAGNPRHSGRWSAEAISGMVKSPTFAGLQIADRRRSDADGGGWHSQPDVYIDDNGQPVTLLGGENARVITPAERQRILAILAGRTRASGLRNGAAHGGGHVSTTLLGGSDGILRCDLCGGRMVSAGSNAAPSGSHGGAGGRGYKCAGIRDKRCPGTTVPRPALESWVMQVVTTMIWAATDDSPLWLQFSGMLAAKLSPDASAHRAAAESAVAGAREVVERIKRLAVTGVLDEAEAAREMVTAKAKLAQAERDLAATPMAGVSRSQAETWLQDVESLTLPERRALIALALREVRVLKVGLSGAKLAKHISKRVTLVRRPGVTWSPGNPDYAPHPTDRNDGRDVVPGLQTVADDPTFDVTAFGHA